MYITHTGNWTHLGPIGDDRHWHLHLHSMILLPQTTSSWLVMDQILLFSRLSISDMEHWNILLRGLFLIPFIGIANIPHFLTLQCWLTTPIMSNSSFFITECMEHIYIYFPYCHVYSYWWPWYKYFILDTIIRTLGCCPHQENIW